MKIVVQQNSNLIIVQLLIIHFQLSIKVYPFTALMIASVSTVNFSIAA